MVDHNSGLLANFFTMSYSIDFLISTGSIEEDNMITATLCNSVLGLSLQGCQKEKPIITGLLISSKITSGNSVPVVVS